MAHWIIGFGYASDVDEIDVPTLQDAEQEARNRAVATGVDLADLDNSVAWACPFDEQKAEELGLRFYDERDALKAYWKSLDPTR